MQNIKSLCVYCGSSSEVDEEHFAAAEKLGKLMAQMGIKLVYGGGRVGLMGKIADSVMESGGQTIGIIPSHIADIEIAHQGLSELHVVETMHERKAMMVEKSDAFLVLSGGFGTLDEFFEVITWRQLGLHQKPVIILNINGYWSHLISLVDHMIESGFAKKEHRDFITVTEHVETVADILKSFPLSSHETDTQWV